MTQTSTFLFLSSLLILLVTAGCDSSGGTRCSFSDPAVLASSSWPKFQRDHGNSGAIPVAPVAPSATVVAQFQTTDRLPFVVQPVLGNGGARPELRDTRVYAGNLDGRLYALDSTTLALLPDREFTFVSASPIRSTALVAVRSEKEALFFGSDVGFLFALDQSGMKQSGFFPFNVGGPVGISIALNPFDGTLYAGTETRTEAGICPNGVLRFLSSPIAPVRTSPAVTPNGEVIWTADDRTVRMTRPDGFLLWSVATSEPVVGGVVVELASDPSVATAIYAVDGAGRLYKLDPESGRILYNVLLPVDRSEPLPRVLSPPAFADGRLYVATVAGEVHAIDGTTGAVVWSHVVPSTVAAPLVVLLHGETRSVVAAGLDARVYVIEDVGPQPGQSFAIEVGAPIRGGVTVSSSNPTRAVLFVADDLGRVSRIE